MISPTDVANVLRLLASAFPTFPFAPDVLGTYGQALSRPPFVDLSVLGAAASRWVDTEDRFPTVHQLGEAYRAEVRRRLDQRRLAEEQRALTAGTLFAGGPAPDPGYATEALDVLRTVLADSVGNRAHKHPGGSSAACETCSRAGELADTYQVQVDDLLGARGLAPPVLPTPTYTCATCDDSGFVVKDPDTFTVRPCRDCNPEGFTRWIDGHRMPGHWCVECKDLVTSRR